MSLFCKHDWSLKNETTTISPMDNLINTLSATGQQIKNAHGYSTERKYIAVWQCCKCGKLKRFVESI